MHISSNISNRTAALAARAAGVVIAVGGIIQITDSPSGETTTVGIEHLGLGTFTALLMLLIPVVLYLGRLAERPRVAAMAVTGLAALAVLTATSNIRGEDLSIFPAVALPSNLLIFGGLVMLAVSLRRRAVLSKPLAVALGLVWIATLPLSNFGGMVLAGGFWLALGWALEHGELCRPAIETSAPARA